jgi:hypothetical protein
MPVHATLTNGKVPTSQLGSATATVDTFLRGDLTWAVPSGGPGGGAPTDAQYLVAAANSSLSAEVVVTTAGLALLDDADAATQRTTLGLGTAATTAATDYATAGHTHAGVYQPLATVLTNTTASFTTAQESKLSGIAAGAEVNVNADWSSGSGDSQILNKPTLGGAAALNVGTAAGTVAAGDHTHAQLHDAVTVADSTTVDLTLTGQQISAAAIVQMSITSDASGLKLSGDSASPGNSVFYGTNGSGTKGWYTPTATAADPSYSPGSFTVSTETSRVAGPKLKLTTTQRITVEGTGRLRVYN